MSVDPRLPEHLALRISLAEDGCWNWTGRRDPRGYGLYSKHTYGGGLAHRLVYAALGGVLEPGKELHHLCERPMCVNPAHLQQVTRAEHIRLGREATKTHCVNGHAYTEDNTYIRPTGQRDCRKCIADRVRAYKRRREAVAA